MRLAWSAWQGESAKQDSQLLITGPLVLTDTKACLAVPGVKHMRGKDQGVDRSRFSWPLSISVLW